MPWTATRSEGIAPLWRRALKVVTPAQKQRSGFHGVEALRHCGQRFQRERSCIPGSPPSKLIPQIFALRQLAKSPRRHGRQVPSWPPCQPTPTRWPFFPAGDARADVVNHAGDFVSRGAGDIECPASILLLPGCRCDRYRKLARECARARQLGW